MGVIVFLLLLCQPGFCCLNDEEVSGNENHVKTEYGRPAWVHLIESGRVMVPTAALVGLLLLLSKRKS